MSEITAYKLFTVERLAYILFAYTCVWQMSNGRAYTLFTYTCGGEMCKVRVYMLFAFTCFGQMSEGRAYMLFQNTTAVGKCPRGTAT